MVIARIGQIWYSVAYGMHLRQVVGLGFTKGLGWGRKMTRIDKTELRREMKTLRRGLTAREKTAADGIICEKLKTRRDIGDMVDPPNCGRALAVYLASPDEINIDPYIEHLLRAGVEMVAPRWNGETYELAKLRGLDEKNLRRGPMGIREPVDADIVEPKKIHAWIIPGLAFTRSGKRLGYGGGWYDRLLASAPKGAVKIGVAYSFQIIDDLISEPHDIMLTDITSEETEWRKCTTPTSPLPLRKLPFRGDASFSGVSKTTS